MVSPFKMMLFGPLFMARKKHQKMMVNWGMAWMVPYLQTSQMGISPKLVGGFNPSEKYARQLGLLFSIYGKIKNVPNHQPEILENPNLRCSLIQVPIVLIYGCVRSFNGCVLS